VRTALALFFRALAELPRLLVGDRLAGSALPSQQKRFALCHLDSKSLRRRSLPTIHAPTDAETLQSKIPPPASCLRALAGEAEDGFKSCLYTEDLLKLGSASHVDKIWWETFFFALELWFG